MSKYVIEFDKEQLLEYDKDTDTYFRTLYKAKGFNALVFDKHGLDKLTPLDKALSSELGEAYHNGFEAGSHEATTLEYQQGLDDAWEAAKKIFALDDFEAEKCGLDDVDGMTASEAIAKIREYEQQKSDAEIKVGDEVMAYSGDAIVFSKFWKGEEEWCTYWYPRSESFDCCKVRKLRKTGRHFPQVEELLNVMKGGDA